LEAERLLTETPTTPRSENETQQVRAKLDDDGFIGFDDLVHLIYTGERIDHRLLEMDNDEKNLATIKEALAKNPLLVSKENRVRLTDARKPLPKVEPLPEVTLVELDEQLEQGSVENEQPEAPEQVEETTAAEVAEVKPEINPQEQAAQQAATQAATNKFFEVLMRSKK